MVSEQAGGAGTRAQGGLGRAWRPGQETPSHNSPHWRLSQGFKSQTSQDTGQGTSWQNQKPLQPALPWLQALCPAAAQWSLPCVARPEEMNSPGAAPRRRAVATVQVCFIANLTLQQGSTTGKAEGLVPVLFSRPWLVPGRRGAATFKGPKLLVFCSQPLPRVGVGAQGTRILANALPSGAGRPRVELGCHRAARWAPFLGGTRRPRPGEWQAGVLVPGLLVAKLGRPSGRWAGPSEGRVEAGRGWTMGNTQNGPSRAEAASRGTKTRKQGHHSWEKRLQE